MKDEKVNEKMKLVVEGYKYLYITFGQMMKISKELKNFIDSGNVEKVEQSLKLREDLINSINDINQYISLNKKAIIQQLHVKEFNMAVISPLINSSFKDELNKLKNAIEKTVKAIIELDGQSEEMLRKQKAAVSQELKKIRQHHEFQNTYIHSPEKFPEPRFFDKKK